MEIFVETIERELPDLAREGVRTRFIGRRDRASDELKATIDAARGGNRPERAPPALDCLRLRRSRGDRRGRPQARRGRDRPARHRRERDRRAPLCPRDAGARPAHPDLGRAAHLQLPALAARLHGARLRRDALAGLRRARAPARRSPSTRAAAGASAGDELHGFLTRLAVAAAGLPIVLFGAYYGGWYLAGLVLFGAVFGLHEFYRAGPLAATARARGVRQRRRCGPGGPARRAPSGCSAGFLLVLPLAFLFAAIAETRQSATVAVGTTVLGAAWVGLGVAALDPHPRLDVDGRLALLTVLLTVFVSDTFAYIGGRLAGRHRMTPRMSPGKTWEGLVFGAVGGVLTTWIALYEEDLFTDGWRPFFFGGVIVVAARLRRPLRVARQARPGREGLGRPAPRPRRRARPDRLAPLRRPRGLLRPARTDRGLERSTAPPADLGGSDPVRSCASAGLSRGVSPVEKPHGFVAAFTRCDRPDVRRWDTTPHLDWLS